MIPSTAVLEDPQLLAHRIARFSGHAVVVGTLFLFVNVALRILVGIEPLHAQSMVFHLLGNAVFAMLWLAVRGERTVRTLHALDMLAMIGAGVAFSAMAAFLPVEAQPDYVLLLVLGYGMVLRAVFVPSTIARTLVIAALLTIPFMGIVVHHATDVVLRVAYMGTWWLVSVSVGAAASHVVYGLRREVHRATRLGQYTIEDKIGEGGMGVVYRARHAFLKRATAVKVLRPELSNAHDIARFEREVQLTSKLTHPNTVHVYDYGRTPDGLFFYAMELIDGASLLEVVNVGGPQHAARVAHVLFQIAGSLAEAHDIGLIHRDVKPANILLCECGGEPDVAKLVDFGMVKQVAHNDSRALTARNALVGTPLYMAPEAITDPHGVDQRSDIYALGGVGYYLLTASDVFEQSSIVAVCSDHLHTAPEPPSSRLGAPIPQALEDLVMACLAKDPEDRPQSARDIQRELEPFIAAHPWPREKAFAWWQRNRGELRMSRERPGTRFKNRPSVVRSPSGDPDVSHAANA